MLRFLILIATATLIAGPARALQLTPSQQVYQVAETVEVVAYNDEDTLISFASSDPWFAQNLTTGEEFYRVVQLPVVNDLEPGESMTFSIGAGYLTPGEYELEFFYRIPPWEPASETTTFAVEGSTSAPGATVSEMKVHFVRR